MAVGAVVTEPLVAFLRARLDEDERVARAATGLAWSVSPADNRNERPFVSLAECGDDVADIWGDHPNAYGEHIALWDPARVLAEVAAKRAILEDHRSVKFTNAELGIHDADVCLVCHAHMDYPDDFTDEQADAWEYPLVQRRWPCPTVRALLLPHHGHPEFHPAWSTDQSAAGAG